MSHTLLCQSVGSFLPWTLWIWMREEDSFSSYFAVCAVRLMFLFVYCNVCVYVFPSWCALKPDNPPGFRITSMFIWQTSSGKLIDTENILSTKWKDVLWNVFLRCRFTDSVSLVCTEKIIRRVFYTKSFCVLEFLGYCLIGTFTTLRNSSETNFMWNPGKEGDSRERTKTRCSEFVLGGKFMILWVQIKNISYPALNTCKDVFKERNTNKLGERYWTFTSIQ